MKPEDFAGTEPGLRIEDYFQGRTRAWGIFQDRFGTVHGYHAHRPAAGDEPAHGALGTFSPAVGRAVGATGLDWEALTGWCAFGFFPGDTTHRPDVKILPPATHIRFGPDGAVESSERWWDWIFAPDRTRSYDATVDAYADRFEAFRRDMEGWIADGRITAREHRVDGLENAPEAFIGLLEGRNFGKVVVRVGDDAD